MDLARHNVRENCDKYVDIYYDASFLTLEEKFEGRFRIYWMPYEPGHAQDFLSGFGIGCLLGIGTFESSIERKALENEYTS